MPMAPRSAESLPPSYPPSEDDDGRTFIWSRQVGTTMRLMLSEAVLMSTLQSRSTRRGRETVGEEGEDSPAQRSRPPIYRAVTVTGTEKMSSVFTRTIHAMGYPCVMHVTHGGRQTGPLLPATCTEC